MRVAERFTAHLDRHGVNTSGGAVRKIINRNVESKADLNLLFKGFNFDEIQNAWSFECKYKSNINWANVRYDIRNIATCLCAKDHSMLLEMACAVYNEKSIVITEEIASVIKDHDYKVQVGVKLTKWLSRNIESVFTPKENTSHETIMYYYNRLCEELVTKDVKQTWYVSTNAYDFIRMSNGNSWSSCHSIDGDYASGCIGYALDRNTFIVYRDNNDNELITRFVGHALGNDLIMGRIYGDSTGLKFVKDTLAHMILAMNGRILTEQYQGEYDEYSNDFTGYKDLRYVDGSIYHLDRTIHDGHLIGAEAICPDCGKYNRDGQITCCASEKAYCECHGERHDIDDMIWVETVNGSRRSAGYYCEDNCVRCDECGEWFITDDIHTMDNGNEVCTTCRDEHYAYCEDCGSWIHDDRMVFDDETDEYVCIDCASTRVNGKDDRDYEIVGGGL